MGINGTIMTYGQTGAGKTFTMVMYCVWLRIDLLVRSHSAACLSDANSLSLIDRREAHRTTNTAVSSLERWPKCFKPSPIARKPPSPSAFRMLPLYLLVLFSYSILDGVIRCIPAILRSAATSAICLELSDTTTTHYYKQYLQRAVLLSLWIFRELVCHVRTQIFGDLQRTVFRPTGQIHWTGASPVRYGCAGWCEWLCSSMAYIFSIVWGGGGVLNKICVHTRWENSVACVKGEPECVLLNETTCCWH